MQLELNRSLLNQIITLKRIGMNLNETYKSAKKVLVLSPHSDDEVISCGGSMIWHSKHLHSIYCCYITDEQMNETNNNIRKKESSEVMRRLNAKDINFHASELKLNATDELVNRLIEIILEIQPEIIYSPSPWESHPDHYRTYELLYKASIHLQKCNPDYNCNVCFYEIWDNSIINSFFIITDYWDEKLELLNLYLSQHKHYIIQLAQSMNHLSALRFLHQDNQYAESFYSCRLNRVVEFNNIYTQGKLLEKNNEK